MPAPSERWIRLGPDCAPVPERLLLAHARGQVLLITGAGVSLPAGLPDFRQLVLDVYRRLDTSTYAALSATAPGMQDEPPASTLLPPQQRAEVLRYMRGDYDVVLGMLERRLEGDPTGQSIVRNAVTARLRAGAPRPAAIHRAIMRLSDRGGAVAVVTTNFDDLLEAAVPRRARPQTYALGAIPRPTLRPEFDGVFHIHGALAAHANRTSDLILTDQDFGEFYLRRRVVPDFIYDAARLFHLVLVGYSANDPPMRYLLNAVAADGARFSDLKERFTFFGAPPPADPVALDDWRGRGITPIPYDQADQHDELRRTLDRWAELSPINGARVTVDRTLRRMIRRPRHAATEADQDLFDHLFRRSDHNERLRLARLLGAAGADLGWLDAIAAVGREPVGGGP
ncbi:MULTISPECIES: SIR2 family protein [unclassified Phenylobacterium]|uniref:SIR2 family protein n=1 Tax=unclassified Phenylobacterium TaxID=2640670 RepID=UPI00083AAE69|nr:MULTISPECIES: SIR2 family protein [unclassified Phenylobacterium]